MAPSDHAGTLASDRRRGDAITIAAGVQSRTGSALGAAAAVRELVLIGIAAAVYGGVRALTEGHLDTAFANAHRIVDLERTLGLAWERAVQDAVIGSGTLVTFANWIYIWGHWPVIMTVAVALYLGRRDRYYVLRNAMFISGGVGFAFFALLPVAPPRLLDGYVDTILERSSSYRTLQPPSLTNMIAAMPSLHFGWNLLVGIALFGATRHLLIRAFAIGMPAAMAFSVVATANHFVLDVVAGGLLVLAAYAVARKATPEAAATLTALDGRPLPRCGALGDRPSRRQRPAPLALR